MIQFIIHASAVYHGFGLSYDLLCPLVGRLEIGRGIRSCVSSAVCRSAVAILARVAERSDEIQPGVRISAASIIGFTILRHQRAWQGCVAYAGQMLSLRVALPEDRLKLVGSVHAPSTDARPRAYIVCVALFWRRTWAMSAHEPATQGLTQLQVRSESRSARLGWLMADGAG